MDYKQTGPDGTDAVNACFCNAVARRGQVVDQHPRYVKPISCTKKEIQILYQNQTAIIGSLWDTDNRPRIFLEVKEYVQQDMELLTSSPYVYTIPTVLGQSHKASQFGPMMPKLTGYLNRSKLVPETKTTLL
jgi:hypothetical protein